MKEGRTSHHTRNLKRASQYAPLTACSDQLFGNYSRLAGMPGWDF